MRNLAHDVSAEEQQFLDRREQSANEAQAEHVGAPLTSELEMTSSDLARLAPPRDHTKDKGLLAKDKLMVRSRAQKIKQAMVRLYVGLTLLILIALGAAGWLIYQEYQKPGKLQSYYRNCSYTNEQSGIEITGKREYFYRDKNIFGFHLREISDLEDKTTIDVRGEPMTVVGMSEGKWWSKYSDMGERGALPVKAADVYVISTKKVGFPIPYAEFCK